jgi:beta-phosphoglucomutase
MSVANPSAVIWDVDGTLVDTAELHFQAWSALCRDLKQPFVRADFTATFGLRNPEIIRQLFGTQYSDAEIADLGRRKEELYRAAARQGVQLLPGVRSLLEGLHAAEFRQAVGSSAPRENLDLILRLTDTQRFFDAVVSQEDTERGKPDPQVFLVAAGKVSVTPARCVVMEDAVAGVQAAKAGGMKCVAVRIVGHHPEARLRDAGADLVVDSLEKVTVQTVAQLVQGGA